MLQLSDIQPPPEELQDYYEQLRAQHVTPAWLGGGISLEPQSQAVPYVWHWRDLRPQAMRAAELVGTQQAERRVLRLTNPNLPRYRQQHAGREHPDRDAGRDRPGPPPFRGGPPPDHRRAGRLYSGEWRARSDGTWRPRADAQLVMARPCQRHRRADDLAGWSRHPVGADAGGRLLRRVPPGAARPWSAGECLGVALPDV